MAASAFQDAQNGPSHGKGLAHVDCFATGDRMAVDLGAVTTREVGQLQLTRIFGQLRMFT